MAPVADPDPEANWYFDTYGYIRTAFDYVQRDPNHDFVGRNSGFVVRNARIGITGRSDSHRLSFSLSVEGAVDVQDHLNTPSGSLDTRLRDAFVRHEVSRFAGLQMGQFKAPFAGEELRSTRRLLFASRAVAQDGVVVGQGFQEEGISVDRQVGVMMSPQAPIAIDDLQLAYYLMVMNGNGSNQLLNDNGDLGFVGRAEVGMRDTVTVAVAGLRNDRTIGELPNLFVEKDTGFAADVAVQLFDFEAALQYVWIKTEFPTVGSDARRRAGYHAQAGYRLHAGGVGITPAYRYAYYHPWFGAHLPSSEEDFDAQKVTYHTFGVRVDFGTMPVSLYADYTITLEPEQRQLEIFHPRARFC